MKFNFKAKTQTGEYKEGTIDSPNQETAASYLQKNNLLPVKIEGISSSKNDLSKVFYKYYDRVGAKDLMEFFKQLAILIDARVPIVLSLTAISEQTINKYLVKVIEEMIIDIENGISFSAAMEKHTDIFSNLSISIIRVGENSGNLKKSIDYVSENIERNYNLSNRIKAALTYPAIILVVFSLVGFLTLSFIVPKLTVIIKELGAEIPWYTQLIISLSDFMANYWWAIAIVILGAVVGVAYYMSTEDGKKEWDRIKIKIPIAGRLFRCVYITRFSQNLGILLTGGIPILRALTIVSSVMNNIVYEAVILKAAEEVKIGGNMSSVLQKSPIIPPMVSHMIKIGEESGQIDSVLGHIGRFYEEELENLTKSLSSLIEPVLMVIIGIAVGLMAIAILMPIYNIAGQIK